MTIINDSNIHDLVSNYIKKMELPTDLRNIPIGDWDVSRVTNMSNLFNNRKSYFDFDEPLNNWNVSNVTNMSNMFNGVGMFNQPLNKWNVSNVTNMNSMFSNTSLFNQPLDKWNVSNVTNMKAMFKYAEDFDQPLNKWNVSNVTNMEEMFKGVTVFNQPLNKWNVSNVTNMKAMFMECDSFDQRLDKWDVSNVTNKINIFSQSGMTRLPDWISEEDEESQDENEEQLVNQRSHQRTSEEIARTASVQEPVVRRNYSNSSVSIESGLSNINMEYIDELSKIPPDVLYNPKCVREKSNWATPVMDYKFDKTKFDQQLFLKNYKNYSPKLNELIKKINKLDEADMRKYGRHFKHFIFSDIKSSAYGAKMIASAFISLGKTMANTANKTGNWDEEDSDSDAESPVSSSGSSSSGSSRSSRSSRSSISSNSSGSLTGGGGKKKWTKMRLLSNAELLETRGNNFFLLSSVGVFDDPIAVSTKKSILSKFNERPNNVHGDLVRFIIMDSGFKEGIDLFDIKYIHVFEPQISQADLTQVVGRGTRTCGQKGLTFNPTRGWPLYVFVYDLNINPELRSRFLDSDTTFNLFLRAMNFDVRLLNFSNDIEKLTIEGAVDYELTKSFSEFSIEKINSLEMTGGTNSPKSIEKSLTPIKRPKLKSNKKRRLILVDSDEFDLIRRTNQMSQRDIQYPPYFTHESMKEFINKYFIQFKWDKLKMENLCGYAGPSTPNSLRKSSLKNSGKSSDMIIPPGFFTPEQSGGSGGELITLSPTQSFIQNYFTPELPIKGMLLWQSVGTGKTCAAIATSTASFEKQGYTILWVTRTTLKNDIWKNMFDQVCHDRIREEIRNGLVMPSQQAARMKLLSNSWSIRPMSYKQFSNLVSKKNIFYKKLVKKNGTYDPLHKTLLIIDEAHKLYGGTDLSSIERPDMNALHDALMNSYAISGNDSARLLLMTATPITNDPMELIKLINLCRPRDMQLEESFDKFSQEYLDENGFFTSQGKHKYLDDIAGYVSYLNRANDPRQFSQPQIKHITADMVSNTEMELIKNFDKKFISIEHKKSTMDLKKQLLEAQERINDANMITDRTRYNGLFKACDKYDDERSKKKCETIVKSSISSLIKEAKEDLLGVKEKAKELKDKIKEASDDKRVKLTNLKELIAEDKKILYKISNSLFTIMSSKCSKKITSTNQMMKELNKHPAIYEIEERMKEIDNTISQLKIEMINTIKSYQDKLVEQKKRVNSKKISNDEKKVLVDHLKNEIKIFNELKTDTKMQFISNSKMAKNEQNKLKTKKNKIIRKIKKTIKKSISDNKKEEKNRKKLDDKDAKLKRKARELIEDIKDTKSKYYFDKYKDIVSSNLQNKLDDPLRGKIEKQQEKIAEKERKVADKTRKKMDKQAEQMQKKLDKEAEKELKKLQQDNEKARKQAEKEAQAQLKKTMKEREKQEKIANKTRKQKK